ncbi:MAG: cytochrome c, partial [Gammaproteobacteria bacterium]|nr:cytochrome c [Gammaproteobacteria bacterium]
MNRSANHTKHVIATILCITTLLGMPSASWAEDFDEAERLYADHCAVCHGADRGGYIGPALNSDQTELTREQISAKIREG